MTRTINLDGREVEYDFLRKKVKNLNIRVGVEGRLLVSANGKVPLEVVENFLRAKRRFILKALDKYKLISEKRKREHRFEDGEIFPYLGRQLKLEFTVGPRSISAEENRLRLSLPEKDAKKISQAITEWYDFECKRVFEQKMEDAYKIFRSYKIAEPKLTVRTMRARWGSCNVQTGKITLNKRLLEAPEECIEYVVFHEFTHLLQPDHSDKFYGLLGAFLPDWKRRKLTLQNSVFL